MFAFYRVPGGKHFCSRFTVHRTDCRSVLTQCLTIYSIRTADILLVSTGLLDDFLMTINIDSKLSSYSASRATEATAKARLFSFLLQIHICTRAPLLSPRLQSFFLFCSTSFVKQMYLDRLVLEQKSQTVITSRLDPLKDAHLIGDP